MRIEVYLGPSRILATVLIAAHAAAGMCVVALDLSGWIKVAAASALLASLVYHLLQHAWLRLPRSIVAVEAQQDGSYAIAMRNGDRGVCALLGSSFVALYLTIVNLKPEDSRWPRHVVILPDAVAAEDFRRLRVWLRWNGAAQAADAPGAAQDEAFLDKRA